MGVNISGGGGGSTVNITTPVYVTTPPLDMQLTVTSQSISQLSSGNIDADGSEQLLTEYAGAGKISGYIDLSEMGSGDEIIIRQYVKVLSTSPYQKYAEETYSGVQNPPLLYLQRRETDIGMKVTLQQTLGVYRKFLHNFVLET